VAALKIFTVATVPDELANAWLQHLRDFDTKHKDCHFEVMADAPDMSMKDMVKAVTINPELSFTKIIQRK